MFVVSLLTVAGAVSSRRATATEALATARLMEGEGRVVVTSPLGQVLEPGEFARAWGLT